jgi:hypothetical protein
VVEYAAAALSMPRMRHRLVEARRSGGLSAKASAIADAALDGHVVELATTWDGDPGSGNDAPVTGHGEPSQG